ncbi:PIG-L family deacetylase [Selenomonas ruminantium]|uniref:GlcNAc-PI de-N-acetylase n=1 Tax=Selenomonas ruminantium TaxID=971 RepID=A0A1H0PJA5_SELRU|nr:PIG-L family deacetylase [Selenomonas ruminantium]SDP05192.1 GlcNAc-PI de-N-acetylase [Selenomonas ruminantium]
MSDKVANSFFQQDYHGVRVLVLAPHPDDEINVAGNMIYSLGHMGAEVFVLYSTNGDFDCPPEKRFAEVEDALELLGVDADHYALLGYGDTYNGSGKPQHVYHAQTTMCSPAGHRETYGITGHEDYHFIKHGQHSAYTKANFLSDLQEYILDIQAEIIFCVDFDLHADHRALSLAFEQAMENILSRKDNAYYPTVYKRFAYATGFTAIRDFSAMNLQETKRPVAGKVESYHYDLVDKSVYQWDKRVRFPVHSNLRKGLFKENPLAQAIFRHSSQHNEKNAYGLLNSDEIFWERRTDDLACKAEITASSGNVQPMRAFLRLHPMDINAEIPRWQHELWRPEQGDKAKQLHYQWEQPQTIEQICLYGAMCDTVSVKEIRIMFPDGEILTVGPLPIDGAPLVVDVNKKDVLALTIQLNSMVGEYGGLSACEIFPSRFGKTIIKPFVKITLDDNFVYNYGCQKDDREIQLSCYKYGTSQAVSYEVLSGNAQIVEERLIWDDNGPVTLKAVLVDDSSVYDIAVLYRWGIKDRLINTIRNFANRLYIKWVKA